MDSVALWMEFIWWGLRWPFVDLLCYVKSQRQTAHGKMSFQGVWPNQSSIAATGVWKKRLSLFSTTGKSLLSPEESCVSSALQGPMLYQFPSDFFSPTFFLMFRTHMKNCPRNQNYHFSPCLHHPSKFPILFSWRSVEPPTDFETPPRVWHHKGSITRIHEVKSCFFLHYGRPRESVTSAWPAVTARALALIH